MNTRIENAARELTADELELVSGGTIVLEDAVPHAPPCPSMNARGVIAPDD